MSVNHTAVVLVGLNVCNLSTDIIDNINLLFYDDNNLVEMSQNCMSSQSERFIGYVVQKSDYVEEYDVTNTAHRLLTLSARFESKFGIKPKVIVMDHVS